MHVESGHELRIRGSWTNTLHPICSLVDMRLIKKNCDVLGKLPWMFKHTIKQHYIILHKFNFVCLHYSPCSQPAWQTS